MPQTAAIAAKGKATERKVNNGSPFKGKNEYFVVDKSNKKCGREACEKIASERRRFSVKSGNSLVRKITAKCKDNIS